MTKPRPKRLNQRKVRIALSDFLDQINLVPPLSRGDTPRTFKEARANMIDKAVLESRYFNMNCNLPYPKGQHCMYNLLCRQIIKQGRYSGVPLIIEPQDPEEPTFLNVAHFWWGSNLHSLEWRVIRMIVERAEWACGASLINFKGEDQIRRAAYLIRRPGYRRPQATCTCQLCR